MIYSARFAARIYLLPTLNNVIFGIQHKRENIPMIGKRFERLVVTKEVDRVKVGIKEVSYRRAFECQCDCGNITVATQLSLNTGNTRSCGCLKSEMMRIRNERDMTNWNGVTYHYLTVVGSKIESKGSHRRWECRCVCGKTVFVKVKDKNRLAAKSCGCKASELVAISKTTHGLTGKKDKNNGYQMYSAMIIRANKKNIECDYVGKPKEFCDWFESRILELDNKCPVFGTEFPAGQKRWVNESATIDRKDVAKGYVVGNIDIISHRANQIKNDGTIEELMAICDYMRSIK